MEPATILLVEDDPALSQTLQDIFELEGYSVKTAPTAAAARASLGAPTPDLIMLDLMLPDADGLVLCSDLKAKLDVPIVVCSATVRKRDSVLALKLGADDFIAKPFDVDELLSRVDAVLRRARSGAITPPVVAATDLPRSSAAPEMPERQAAATPGTATTVDGLTLEHARRRVTFLNQELSLTPTEYRLLAAFMGHPDEVLSRRDLAQLVWGYEDASVGRSIDVHVHRLRTKLQAAQEAQGRPGANVISVRGFGYKLHDDAAVSAAAA